MAIAETDLVFLCVSCSLPLEDCKCSERKPAPGKPYFTVEEAGWGTKWEVGKTVYFKIGDEVVETAHLKTPDKETADGSSR